MSTNNFQCFNIDFNIVLLKWLKLYGSSPPHAWVRSMHDTDPWSSGMFFQNGIAIKPFNDMSFFRWTYKFFYFSAYYAVTLLHLQSELYICTRQNKTVHKMNQPLIREILVRGKFRNITELNSFLKIFLQPLSNGV